MVEPPDTPAQLPALLSPSPDGSMLRLLVQAVVLPSEMLPAATSSLNNPLLLVLNSLLYCLMRETVNGDVLWFAADRARDMCKVAGLDEDQFRAILQPFVTEVDRLRRTTTPYAY